MAAKSKPTTLKKIDAIKLLEKDHKTVRALLKKWTSSTNKDVRTKLLRQIEKEIKIHTKIEEDIFYPAFHEAAKNKEDNKLFYEAHEEHHLVDLVFNEIKKVSASSDKFAAKAKVIKDLVEHHAEEEENEMFPRARKLIDSEQLYEIGTQLQAKKAKLDKKL